MYICKDCKKKFAVPFTFFEEHGLDTPPYEKFTVCPHCKGENIKIIETRHCKCCGARLKYENRGEYCNERCRKRGERLWKLEEQRRKKRMNSPLNEVLNKLKEYNEEHKTRLSYGQFVAKVLVKA